MSIEQKSFSGYDQRYLPRWEVRLPLHYKRAEEETIRQDFVKDISAAGICLTSKEALNLAEQLELTVFLSENKYIHARGKVVWVEDCAGHYEAGVDFINLSASAQDTILNHAFELNRTELARNWFKGWS